MSRSAFHGPFRQWPWSAKLGLASVVGWGVLLGVLTTRWLSSAPSYDAELAAGPADNSATEIPADPSPAPPANNAPRPRPARATAAPAAAPVPTLADIPPLEIARAATEAAAASGTRSVSEGDKSSKESKLSADFDCALAPNAKKLSDTHFVLDMENKYEYMFLFKLTGVAGKTIRIDCKNVPLAKWRTLNPVYRYAHDGLPELLALLPDNYKLSDVKTTQARNGALLPDTTGQAWHFIPDVWAGGGGTLSFVQTFDKDEVTVAMKTPFTLEDEKLLCAEAAKCPNAQVIDIGKTPEGRTLHVIKVSTGGEEGEKTHPCILMYAREHADEHDSSWVVAGALRRAMALYPTSEQPARGYTLLFIPILDADAAVHALHEHILSTFSSIDTSPESNLYGAFFQTWMKQANPLHLVIDMHNIESAEGDQLLPGALPPMLSPYSSGAIALHGVVFTDLTFHGFSVRHDAWKAAMTFHRLDDWLCYTSSAVPVLYEVNSQNANRHLSRQELEFMGGVILQSAMTFLQTSAATETKLAVGEKTRVAVFLAAMSSINVSPCNRGKRVCYATRVDPGGCFDSVHNRRSPTFDYC